MKYIFEIFFLFLFFYWENKIIIKIVDDVKLFDSR